MGGTSLRATIPTSPGVYREPSLSAQPGSLVLLGDRLTLQCRSDAGFGRFALTKDEGSTPPLRLDGQNSPDFTLGHVSHTRGGRYRCYAAHNPSDAWSAPSAPLDVLMVGEEPLSCPWPDSLSRRHTVVMGSRERGLEQRLRRGSGLRERGWECGDKRPTQRA